MLLTCDSELFLGWVGGAWCLSAKRPDVAVVSKVLGAQAAPHPEPRSVGPVGTAGPHRLSSLVFTPVCILQPMGSGSGTAFKAELTVGCEGEDLKPGCQLQSGSPVRATGGPGRGSGPVQRPDPRAAGWRGPPDTSLYCGKTHNIKFTPSPIVKQKAQWRFVHSWCCATSTSVLFQNFFITPRKRHTHEP